MQSELIAEGIDASILGVNEVGFDSANDTITEGRDLPWLQETDEALVWTPWDVTYRDVIVLDGENKVFGVFNLTSQSLAEEDNYNTLKTLIIGAAQ